MRGGGERVVSSIGHHCMVNKTDSVAKRKRSVLNIICGVKTSSLSAKSNVNAFAGAA